MVICSAKFDPTIRPALLRTRKDGQNVNMSSMRGIRPSLTNFGVPNALADPTLELRNSNGALIRANNDWRDDLAQAVIITGFGLAPTNRGDLLFSKNL